MKLLFFLLIFIPQGVYSTPILQMNKAFTSIFDLGPYLSNENRYLEEKNAKTIQKSLDDLEASFQSVGHDKLIKHDLFAPSYKLISENIKESSLSFKNKHKSYSFWILKETLTLCLDCHSRLPQNLTSSFQNGELYFNPNNIKDPYELGMTYLIVRRFSDAQDYFIRSIQEKIIKKEIHKILMPFQQILMIELKIRKDPAKMISIIDDYLQKKHLPSQVENELKLWKQRLDIWKRDQSLTKGINSEKELNEFIKRRLEILKEDYSFNDALKVDLLLASGIISEYYFENQNSRSAPEINYWLGWLEKRLKKENFLSTGNLYFKQCMIKYPKSARSKDCLEEYKESVEFDFSGSRGTAIPSEIKKELKDFSDLIEEKKK